MGEDLKCQGNCEHHQGVVRTVWMLDWPHSGDRTDWDYCETAIARDKRKGFKFEEPS